MKKKKRYNPKLTFRQFEEQLEKALQEGTDKIKPKHGKIKDKGRYNK